MMKYYFLEIVQTQAFDMIIGVSCIIPFYFLMKFYITTMVKDIHDKLDVIQNDLDELAGN